jgi:large subunit ribosomal protein L13
LIFNTFFSIILTGTFKYPTLIRPWESLIKVKGEKNMTSYMQKKETVERKWYVIDAEGKSLGRVASLAATYLRGKNKPTYTPHIDCGDYIIIVNASKVNLTGDKLDKKMYYNHSQYVGGLRERTARTMREEYPEEMIERAVKGMLPHNRLGRQMYKKLFVYAGNEHKQQAQKPEVLEVK